MSEAASPSNRTPPTPPAPDLDADFDPPISQEEAESLAAAAAPGLLPALGEDLSCLGGGLAAFAGEGLVTGAETDSEYELDDYDHVGAPRSCLIPCLARGCCGAPEPSGVQLPAAGSGAAGRGQRGCLPPGGASHPTCSRQALRLPPAPTLCCPLPVAAAGPRRAPAQHDPAGGGAARAAALPQPAPRAGGAGRPGGRGGAWWGARCGSSSHHSPACSLCQALRQLAGRPLLPLRAAQSGEPAAVLVQQAAGCARRTPRNLSQQLANVPLPDW